MGAAGQVRIRNYIDYTFIFKMTFCVLPNLTQLWAIANSDPIPPSLFLCFTSDRLYLSFMSYEILLIQLCSKSCKPADLIENVPSFFVDQLFDGPVDQIISLESLIINRSRFTLVKERE